MPAYIDEEDNCIIVQSDKDSVTSDCQLKDIQLNEKFAFNNQVFEKTSELGWGICICNCKDSDNRQSHIHPTTKVMRLQ